MKKMKLPEVRTENGKVVRRSDSTQSCQWGAGHITARSPVEIATILNERERYITALHDKIDSLLAETLDAASMTRVWVIENCFDDWDGEVASYLAVAAHSSSTASLYGDFVWVGDKDRAWAFATEGDATGFLLALQRKLAGLPHRDLDPRLMEFKHRLKVVEHIIETPDCKQANPGDGDFQKWWMTFVNGLERIEMKNDFYISGTGERWIVGNYVMGILADAQTLPEVVLEYEKLLGHPFADEASFTE